MCVCVCARARVYINIIQGTVRYLISSSRGSVLLTLQKFMYVSIYIHMQLAFMRAEAVSIYLSIYIERETHTLSISHTHTQTYVDNILWTRMQHFVIFKHVECADMY